MKRFLVITLILAGFVLTSMVAAQTTEFSYDGRVRSGGVPFDGNGLFKFAIVSSDGTICYWSNDGVTLTGNEPTNSIQIAVSAGFFSVIMGDDSIANMAPLDASIFNTDERVLLRVWFSDGVNGFQKLSPDRPISNPALIGLQYQKELTMYVNPITGNDRFPGNSAKKPKKTIQAAWNALPRLLSTTATIKLADGEYYESVLMQGKYVPGDCRIILRGDPSTYGSARLFGSLDRHTSTTRVRKNIITINYQSFIRLEYLRFDYPINYCVDIRHGSFVEMNHCLMYNTYQGIQMEDRCTLYLTNSILADSLTGPYMARGIGLGTSSAYMDNVQFIHLQSPPAGQGTVGIDCVAGGYAWVTNSVIDGWTKGVRVLYNSFVSYGPTDVSRGGGMIIRNCNTGTEVGGNSASYYIDQTYGYVTYSNCQIPFSVTGNSSN